LLSVGGDVFSWGRGRHGALGHGDFEDQPAPRKVGRGGRVWGLDRLTRSPPVGC
jgi:alpha-tubulin suppressor-like RCC1 family protein